MKRCFAAEGDSGGYFAVLVPDRDVRVSVKALALSCVGAAVALHPESFFSKLYKVPLDTTEYPGMLKFTPPSSCLVLVLETISNQFGSF